MNGEDVRNGGGGAEARVQLSLAAMSAERRNRPRGLVAGALVLLVLAGGYFLYAWVSRASAASRAETSRLQLVNLHDVATKLKAQHEFGSGDDFRPERGRMVGYLQALAAESGLPGVEVSRSGKDTEQGFVRPHFQAMLTERDPSLLLQWVARAASGEPPTGHEAFRGIEAHKMKLTPGHELESGVIGWNLTVTFKRWEREE